MTKIKKKKNFSLILSIVLDLILILLKVELIIIQNCYHRIIEVDMRKREQIKFGKMFDHKEIQKVFI
jgi:hypothetical protein